MKYDLKKTLSAVALFGAALVFAVGCGKKNDSASTDSAATANNIAKTVSDAMNGASGGAAQHKSSAHALPSDKLASFLPQLSGFTAKEPEKASMNVQGTEWSSASQEFNNGDKSIKISILDYNYIAGLTAAYTMAMNINMENGEELHKGEKFGNYPGWVEWKKKANEGTIGVIVNDRVFVVVEGRNGVSLDDLRAALGKVDLDGIGKAASV